MKTVSERTPILKDCVSHYCPGCGHGVAHRLVAEAIDELGLRGRTVGIAPVGCAVLAYHYLDVDMVEVAHGRAPAVATGIKRVRPDHIVFTYQGDGDLASIGAAEILHAGHRGERITVIFVNNAIYGMTQGQMAPTTLLGQITETSPKGRNAQNEGYPLQVSEIMATLPGVIYVERCSLHDVSHIQKAKNAVLRAFELQNKQAKGLAFVELLSPCPTYWRMTPVQSRKWMADEMIQAFPLGQLKYEGGSP
jgi:2-oxoglutarate/2-oxoacid ferredoxin oxidoreductase subunit beta